MVRVFTLFIGVYVIVGTVCHAVNVPNANQSLVFMDKLKTVLRTNNDDYVDTSQTNKTTTTTTTSATKATTKTVAHTTTKKQATTVDVNRRAMNFNSKNKSEPITPTNYTKYIKNTSKPNTVTNEKKEFKDKYPKYVNKISKMKTFFKKNKDLFKKFMNNRSSKLIPMLRFRNTTLTTYKPTVTSKGTTTSTVSSKAVVGPGRTGKIGRAWWSSSESSSKSSDGSLEYMDMVHDRNHIADSRQLDMAPAKGGYIHAQRLKGRLCQRNVLIPEGPKYDSKGVSYLPAYTPVRGHDFAQTKKPKAYLPRCCNCCKKSVLGCE